MIIKRLMKMSGYICSVLMLIVMAPDLYAQNQTVSGTVMDAQSGETLPGVNILVKGTSTGTATDTDGRFSLNVSSLQDTLVFHLWDINAGKCRLMGVPPLIRSCHQKLYQAMKS